MSYKSNSQQIDDIVEDIMNIFTNCSDMYIQLNQSYQNLTTTVKRKRKHNNKSSLILNDDYIPKRRCISNDLTFNQSTYDYLMNQSIQEVFNTAVNMQLESNLERNCFSSYSSHVYDSLLKDSSMNDVIEQSNSIEEAIVITESHAPFHIIHVNNTWENLCGYTKEEVQNRTLRFIQGALTDSKKLFDLGQALKSNLSHHTKLINYKKNGSAFLNDLTVNPLINESGIFGFIGVLRDQGDVFVSVV